MHTNLEVVGNTFSALASENALLKVALVLVSGIALVLAGILGLAFYRGLPIHYIPLGGAGISRPGEMPDVALTDYATACMQARWTFTPETVPLAHAAVMRCLHPSMRMAWKVQAEKEAKVIKKDQISLQTLSTDTKVVGRERDRLIVAFDGLRTITIGSQQVRTEAVHAEVVLVPWLDAGRPLGLAIVGLRKISPALSAAGD